MIACGVRARQCVERKRMHEKLRDRIALADQAQELPFGGLERGIGHHVEQADMQFANILLVGMTRRQHAQALALQLFERW